jgi:putative CocE/NonD family hydrolase
MRPRAAIGCGEHPTLIGCGIERGRLAARLVSMRTRILSLAMAALGVVVVTAQQPPAIDPPNPVRASYTKYEHLIPMRDGVRLFTSVYVPKVCSAPAPIIMQRTPYSVAPYGIDNYRTTIGPSEHFLKEGMIGVYQDVRGRYLSEGEWMEVRPHNPKKTARDIDESTDTWDTIDWLVKNIPCNNGRVGMWGISYPGFYASAGMIDAHPALKAVSPQAPVTDYYRGDDSFHNGAFMLAANFGFYTGFQVRPKPERPQPRPSFDYGTPSGYEFFLQMGSLWSGAERYGLLNNPYYRGNLEHTSYDEFWKARSLWQHFTGITPAVLTVGGWFDAEDLAGPLLTYRALRKDSPATKNRLVMGPWTHGSWARGGEGRVVGNLDFGQPASEWYRAHVEFPFFMEYLKDRVIEPVAEATMFETGTNQWRTFTAWPPVTTPTTMYLGARGGLSAVAPTEGEAFDQYLSDPNRPVPYVGHVQMGMQADYMTEDQRFAATRPDVLVYMTPPLEHDLTVLGPIGVDLHVATSGTDSDFVVKVIDVFPGDYPTPEWKGAGPAPANRVRMGGYQQLVRGEPFRGKFRQGFEKPVPFVPNQPDRIRFNLPDVAHTFRSGHRLMVQVQSSWFPLTDRNPQVFTDIPKAKPEDFTIATQRVYRSQTRASAITLPAERK